MDVCVVDGLEEFVERAGPFLARDEARHNLILGLAHGLLEKPDMFCAPHLRIVEEAGRVVGAALRTPPHNLVVSRVETEGALEALAAALRTEGAELPGVIGGVPEADAFAEIWCAAEAARVTSRVEQGIYALTEVEPVPAVPGEARPAGEGDFDLALDWYRAFMAEADPGNPWHEKSVRKRLRHRISGEGTAGLRIWDDGGMASMTGFGGPTPCGIRVGPVYTPPEKRGRGYATALVAAASAMLLENGRRFCFLYTDMANPTSNAIYRRIGYRLVCGSAQIGFGPA